MIRPHGAKRYLTALYALIVGNEKGGVYPNWCPIKGKGYR